MSAWNDPGVIGAWLLAAVLAGCGAVAVAEAAVAARRRARHGRVPGRAARREPGIREAIADELAAKVMGGTADPKAEDEAIGRARTVLR